MAVAQRPILPMSGRAHQGYAADPDLPMSARAPLSREIVTP
jgi:hypothetical protein